MASKMDVIIQHALKTFSKFSRRAAEFNPREINELKSLTNNLTASDIETLGTLLSGRGFKEFMRARTPLDRLSVYEDNLVSVGVFLLKEGAKLPIHDHPDMYGIIRVLEGVIKVTSYTFFELDSTVVLNDSNIYYNNPLKVLKHPEIYLKKHSESCLLTPNDKNIHEVECVEGPAAFLDILSPPYEDGEADDPRSCHYFKEVDSSNKSDGYLRLVQIVRSF